MSVISNLLTILVLVIIFMLAFMLVTSQSVNFARSTVDNKVQLYTQKKVVDDIDSILNVTEPVSKAHLVELLADSIYYRRAYFDYAPKDTLITPEIEQYYNNSLYPAEEKKFLQVGKFVQTVFDKLYGSKNYYLEIRPKITKLRLYFILDGSPSIENEAETLRVGIPKILADFNNSFEVSAKVYVLAGDTLVKKVDPCKAFRGSGILCKYLYEEELYTDLAPNGWMTYKMPYSGYLLIDPTTGQFIWNEESHQLNSSSMNAFATENFSHTSGWFITKDEFLEDQFTIETSQYTLFDGTKVDEISRRYTMMWCTWAYFGQKPSSFEVQMNYAGQKSAAKFWVNGIPHTVSEFPSINNNGIFVDASADLNAGWNKLCLGYWPNPKEENQASYSVKINGQQKYFSEKELYAFRNYPKDYTLISEDVNITNFGGVFYEDWGTGSIYAAMQAEQETPSTFTAIIPISDELSTGSENDKCFLFPGTTTDFGFCMACNKIKNATGEQILSCPTERADKDINRAVDIIKPLGYFVFPVLANSCDIPDWMAYTYNGYCRVKGYNPYGCGANMTCGQCFGPNETECPGLTVVNGVGCDKVACRDAIKEDMTYLASETAGEVIELSQLDELEGKLRDSIRATIEKFTIKSGERRPNDERFAVQRVVPLSNKLYTDFTFWLYKERIQEQAQPIQ